MMKNENGLNETESKNFFVIEDDDMQHVEQAAENEEKAESSTSGKNNNDVSKIDTVTQPPASDVTEQSTVEGQSGEPTKDLGQSLPRVNSNHYISNRRNSPRQINAENFKQKKIVKSRTNEKNFVAPPEDKWEAVFPDVSETPTGQPNLLVEKTQDMNDDQNSNTQSILTESQLELCQIIDLEYDQSLESLNIILSSKYASFRQSAFISFLFFITYLVLGTIFYVHHHRTKWSVADALLYSIYTITTVGYGHKAIPRTAAFQIFTIFYILVGIAALTIAVAQTFSWIALEATRSQYAQDKAEIKRKSGMLNQDEIENENSMERDTEYEDDGYNDAKDFLKNTSCGRALTTFLPLIFLVLIGAMIVAPIEGWSFMEGIYWAVVTLTTVGYGQYYPTKRTSIWFCIFYLPLSIGFMSVFLSNVAKFYIHMNNSNIHRIQKRMWLKLLKQKEKQEKEQKHNGSSQDEIDDEDEEEDVFKPEQNFNNKEIPQDRMPEGYDTLANEAEKDLDSHSWFGNDEVHISVRNIQDGLKRREKVHELQQMSFTSTSKSDRKMTTMKDVLSALKYEEEKRHGVGISSKKKNNGLGSQLEKSNTATSKIHFDEDPKSKASPEHLTQEEQVQSSKPSFYLRAMVQERMAYIIANDIAGYQSMVETSENTLSVFIETFKFTAEKWMIPKKVRKEFQSLAFEALFFVGERNLIINGADALLQLGPLEFNGLFAASLAAMGDAETMEAWLTCTKVLSDVEFKKGIKGEEVKKGKILKNIDQHSLPRMIMEPGKEKRRRLGRRGKKNSSKAINVEKQNDRFEIV